jgi:hypothetical protein
MVTATAAKPTASSQYLFRMVTFARRSCRYFRTGAAWNGESLWGSQSSLQPAFSRLFTLV